MWESSTASIQRGRHLETGTRDGQTDDSQGQAKSLPSTVQDHRRVGATGRLPALLSG